jgi:hypothetical protein
MLDSKSDQRYSSLPVNQIPLSGLLLEEYLFYNVPDNWHVSVTDINPLRLFSDFEGMKLSDATGRNVGYAGYRW